MTMPHGKKRLTVFVAAVFALCLLNFTAPVQAQGGPPMLTDDPGTPGNQMWEVNFLFNMERSREARMFEAPNIDINYGLGDHLQLKFEAPFLVRKESGAQTMVGTGNSMVGVKWRFLDEERSGVSVSTYPQLEFNNPTRSVARGLVERGVQLFLPVEAVKQIGPVEVNGEMGYRFVQHGADELEYGLAIARQVTRRFELIGEVHGSALRTLREDELFLNAGSRFRFSKNGALLFSAGRTIRNSSGEGPQYIATFGVQFNFRNKLFGAAKDK